jgi:polyisoprenoid-binding protein YceI
MLKYHRALPVAFAFALVAAAPLTTDSLLTVRPGSRLWVDGTSTVRSFSCEASSFNAEIQATEGAVSAVLGGVKAVQTVDVTVPVRALDCKNGKMNQHMLKALKADAHPEISFRLTSYDLVQAGEAVRATLTGTLTMGGVEKPITFDADVIAGDSGVVEVGGSVDVNMKDFGLKPPSLMLGTMKVRELVNVRFELLLQQ